jgi:CRP-like cAMP-binding protein
LKLPNIFDKPGSTKAYPAGSTIFAAGDPPDFMYVVKTGQVDIMIGDRVVETVGPDGFFGELALVDKSSRSATAKAKTDCELAPISEKQFLFMASETPFFSLTVMREMAHRLRRAP